MRRRLEILGLRLYSATVPMRPHGLEEPTEAPVRILVQVISGIGNALMATPLVAELRRLYPQARIDVMVTPVTAPILEGNPHATSIISDPYVTTRRREDYWLMVRRMKEARYDVCFLALTAVDFVFAVRPLWARIGTRLIHDYALYPSNRFTALATHRVPFDQTRHDVESNLDLLRAVTRAPVKAGHLVLHVSPCAHEDAVARLRGLGWDEAKRTVAFCPGSTLRWSNKRWPNEHFRDLANELLSSHRDVQVVVFCGPDEQEDAAYFAREFQGRSLMVAQSFPLQTYAAALTRCRVVITGDSLPLHMCAALQVPQVSLFGPTDPRRTGPWMTPARVLVPNCDFVPYYRMPYPPDPSSFPPCMPLISVEEVLLATESFLDKVSGQESRVT